MSDDPNCPICGGHVIVVLKRAWCVGHYKDDGCGCYWSDWPKKIDPPWPHGAGSNDPRVIAYVESLSRPAQGSLKLT